MSSGEYLDGLVKCPRTGCRQLVDERSGADFCSEHCYKLWLTNFNENLGHT